MRKAPAMGIILFVLSALVCAGATYALTPANTVITNQANASYFDTWRGVGATATSNVASIRVATRRGVLLEEDRVTTAAAGMPVYLAHVVTNTGNAPDAFVLDAENLAGDDFDLTNLQIIYDTNNNGVPDPGEPLATQTTMLQPGVEYHLVVSGNVPGAVGKDYAARLSVVARSQADPGLQDLNTDRVQVGDGILFRYTKDTLPVCAEPVDPGAIIRYTLRYTNIGFQTPTGGNITLDGAPAAGVIIEDTIPPNVDLVPGQNVHHAPGTAVPILQLASSGANEWISFDAWNGTDVPSRVGMLVSAANAGPNKSGLLAFDVRVISAITPGTVILNSGAMDVDGDGQDDFTTNTVCNTLKPLDNDDPGKVNDAVIRFLEPVFELRRAGIAPDFANDAHYQDVGLYNLDSGGDYQVVRDGAYLEVHSTSLNASSFMVDQVQARVESSLTGDHLRIVLVETGVNTGVFRGVKPIRLTTGQSAGGATFSPGDPGYPYLNSTTSDRLIASIEDPGMGVVITDSAVVDPLGVVFDSTTMQPVAGAVVSVRNPDGTLALDPDVGGGATLPPQTTGGDGRYHFPRLYPGTYYVFVDPPAGYAFPSTAPAATFTGIREVGPFSYGQDGYHGTPTGGEFTLNAGDPALIVDIPVDPDSTNRLVIEKTALVTRAQPGDFIPYEVRLRNNSGAVLLDARVRDELPYGFKYEPGTARLNGNRAIEPSGGEGPVCTFPIGRMDMGDEVVLTYFLLVTPGAVDGDGYNSARALSQSGGGVPVNSMEVRAHVEVVQEGLFSEDAIIFGKVFFDLDDDGMQSRDDVPVGGARLYLEDGTWVVTDHNGQYLLYGRDPGLSVIKLDEITLPPGIRYKASDNRHGLDGRSRFVDLVPSDFHRADFLLGCPDEGCDAVIQAVKRRNKTMADDIMLEEAVRFEGIGTTRGVADDTRRELTPAGPDGDISSGVVYPWDARRPTDPDAAGAAPAASGRKPMPRAEAVAADVTREMADQGTWLWPEDDVARDGRFVVVVRKANAPRLVLNGEDMGAEHLGEQVLNTETGAQVLAYYGVALVPGENRLRIVGTDSFGNERTLAEKTFRLPGPAAQMRLLPASDTLDADGAATLPVEVRIEDARGLPATGVHYVTLECTDGAFAEQDIQDSTAGHQIRVENGRAMVHFRGSNRAGEVTLRACAESDLCGASVVRLAEPLRPMIAVGLVDISARFGDMHGSSVLPPDQADGFDDEIEVDGRGAVFLKGKIKGDILLTFAYDSDKDLDDELFRDIDPDAYYPIYGDSSRKGFEAQSRSKVYVRLDKGPHSVMWGDYRTDYQDYGSLARYQRTLTGANAHAAFDRIEARAFYSRAEHPRFLETLRGNGTAMLYRLSHTPIVSGSETIEIVTRARNNPGLVVERRQLSRFADYTIDYVSGHITFHEAVPSVDESFRPVFIEASYETTGDGDHHDVYGARAEANVAGGLFVGGSATVDRHPDDGLEMLSGHVRYELGERHEVVGEVAAMNGMGESGDGMAHRLELTSSWSDTFETEFRYLRAEEGFSNPDAPVAAGREEMRGRAEYRFTRELSTVLEGISSRAIDGADERRSAYLGAEYRTGPWLLAAGARRTDQDETVGDADVIDSVLARAERGFNLLDRMGNAYLEWEQDIHESERRAIRAGAEYWVHEKAKLYGANEVIDSLEGITALSSDTRRIQSTVGVSTSFLASDTETYHEYRLEGGMSGREGQAVNGIRGGFDIVPDLTFSPRFEYVHYLEGPEESDAWAVSLGLADKRHQNRKSSVRMETRQADANDYYGFLGSYAARLAPDWTGIVKERLAWDVPGDGDERVRHTFTLGVARRPLGGNRYHFLGLYQWVEERNQDDLDMRRVHLFSTHHNLRVNRDVVLSGNLAAKWQTVELADVELNSTTQLAGLRTLWDLTRRLDVDVHGGCLSTGYGDSVRYAAGVGLYFNVVQNVRIGVGYNLVGFRDDDLDQERYWNEGLNLGLRVKMDEHLFDFLWEPKETD